MRRVPVPFGASVDEKTGQLVESNIRFEIDRALPPNTVVSYYISVTIPSHLTQSITMPPASSSIILRCRKLVETKDHVVVLYFCDKTKNMTTSVTASPLKIHLNTFKISNETSKDLLECKDNKEILPRTFRPSILKRSMKGKEISWEEFQRITRNNDTLIVKSNNNNNTIQTSVLNHFRKIWNRCNCQYDCVRSAMCMFFRTLVSLHRTYSVPFEPSYEFVLSSSQVESLFRDWPDVAFCHEDVGDDDGLCLSALICVVLRLGYRWLDGEKKKKKKEYEEKKHIVKPPTYSNSTTSSTRQKKRQTRFSKCAATAANIARIAAESVRAKVVSVWIQIQHLKLSALHSNTIASHNSEEFRINYVQSKHVQRVLRTRTHAVRIVFDYFENDEEGLSIKDWITLCTRTGILNRIDLRLAHLCFLWSLPCDDVRFLDFEAFQECLVRVASMMSGSNRRSDGYDVTNLNETLSDLIVSMLRSYRQEHRRVVDKMKECRRGSRRRIRKVSRISKSSFSRK